MTRTISILGSTGSIGESGTDLIRRADPGAWQVVALTANRNAEKLAAQAIEFGAQYVALADETASAPLKTLLDGTDIAYGLGPEAVIEAGRRGADFTLSSIMGAAGLEPTLAAVERGQHVGLANKECLVCAGDVFMSHVQKSGATLLPVDSEHNAIFQVLEQDRPEGVRRLILTASGGPFRGATQSELDAVTRSDALAHPVWDMGAKISIDSATLMNKGLELIEASYLFARPSRDIDVIVHPQSIVHSMVEYIDGSILAQLGSPDMRTPIAYAMGWPDRMEAPVQRLDLATMSQLSFFEPDLECFPALRLAREALEAGGKAPNVLNAANEMAVAAFLSDQIGFTSIARVVENVLDIHSAESDFLMSAKSVEEVIETDSQARRNAKAVLPQFSRK